MTTLLVTLLKSVFGRKFWELFPLARLDLTHEMSDKNNRSSENIRKKLNSSSGVDDLYLGFQPLPEITEIVPMALPFMVDLKQKPYTPPPPS